jgi:hypothetical protein
MGPGHPSYPSNPPQANGAWPSMPQWPSDNGGWPAEQRGGQADQDGWLPPRGPGGWGGDGKGPLRRPGHDGTVPWNPGHDGTMPWNPGDGAADRDGSRLRGGRFGDPLGDRPPGDGFGERAGSPRPGRHDFPETDSAATGPMPKVGSPPANGDDYLPIFAAVESAWFAGGASWDSAKPDAGWTKAETVMEPVRDGATASGLPKRVPKANLVPGSADTAAAPKGVTPTPSVSPDRVRNRLSSFQQGFRAARDDINDGKSYPTGPRNVDSREEGA